MIGKVYTNKKGLSYEVIRRKSDGSYDIMFSESKKVITNVFYNHILNGIDENFVKVKDRNYSQRIGEVYVNKRGEEYEVISYNAKNHHCNIKFLKDGVVVKDLQYHTNVKLGLSAKYKTTQIVKRKKE